MSRELYVFPTRDKRPLTPRGLYDAQPESHWSGEESEQWAAPCGEKNGFFVVDVDNKVDTDDPKGRTGVQYHKEMGTLWEAAQIIPTPSGGYHVLYKYTQDLGNFKNSVRIDVGTDFRTEGGYIVLYDAVNIDALTPMPAHLVANFTRLAAEKAKKFRSTDLGQAQDIGEGGRNAYLAKAAGRMQKLGVLTLAALQEVNERDCSPPLDDFEVEGVFKSVSRYAPDSTPGEDETPAARTVWVGDMVAPMLEFLRNKEKTRGEPTGIKALDDLLGGRRLGELTVTMAEAKTGKNTWWHQQLNFMLNRGIAIGYASRELSPETEVLPNLLTLKLGVNIYKADDITEEAVLEAISGWKLAFSNGYGAFQGNELFEWLEECVGQGVKYFFLDHMHYMTQDSEDFKVLADFGRKLKTFTKTHQVSVDLIVQPKVRPSFKVGDKMQKADMDINMLRGGSSLGQVLDSLITMDRLTDDDGNLTNVVKIDLKRARSKLSRTGTFFMQYNADNMVFTECGDPREEEPAAVHDYDGPPRDRTGQSPFSARRENPRTPGYGTSKSGEFFDLKRSVSKMLGEIKRE